MLYRYAVYLVKNQDTAQDLCQEVFIRWFTRDDSYQITKPEAWLKKVLSNLAFNYFRRQKIRFRTETNYNFETIEVSVDMHKEITRMEVEEVLQVLSWKDQLLLKMRMMGLSYAEIAEVMDVSTGSVGTMLARAMKRFRQYYETEKEVENRNDVSGHRQVISLFGRRTIS